MRSSISLAALPFLLAVVPAQVPDAPKADPRADLARFVKRLDTLLQQVDTANETARAASGTARTVEAQARDGGLEQAAKALADAQQELDQLANLITERATALRVLRLKLAADAPAQLVDPLRPLVEKIEAVVRMHSLADAEAGLMQIEKTLLEEPACKTPGADTLLAMARYRLAETLRHRASEVRLKSGDAAADKLLRRASAKLTECLTGPDGTNSGEGSSLHAAALRRIVQLEATMYDASKRLSEAQPTARTYREAAKKHREAAESAFEKLRRLHATATLPDGTMVLEAVRPDIDRLAPR